MNWELNQMIGDVKNVLKKTQTSGLLISSLITITVWLSTKQHVVKDGFVPKTALEWNKHDMLLNTSADFVWYIQNILRTNYLGERRWESETERDRRKEWGREGTDRARKKGSRGKKDW